MPCYAASCWLNLGITFAERPLRATPQGHTEWLAEGRLATRIAWSHGGARHRGSGHVRVFISYRRSDSPDVAGRIHDRLVESFGGNNVYYDVDSIPFGVDFRHKIDSMIKECDAVLVVIGPRWLKPTRAGQRQVDSPLDFVRVEVEAALHRDIRVVPVLVHGADVPPSDQLPESIRELSYRHGLSVRQDPDFHGDMSRLIKSLVATGSLLRDPVSDEGESVSGQDGSPAGEKDSPPVVFPTVLLPQDAPAPVPKKQVAPAPLTKEAAKTTTVHTTRRRSRTAMLLAGLLVIVVIVGVWLITRSNGSPGGEFAEPAESTTPPTPEFAMADVVPTVGSPGDLEVDGNHLLVTLAPGGLQRIDPGTKTVVGEVDFDFDGAGGLLLTPDGPAVLGQGCRVGFVDAAFEQSQVIDAGRQPRGENTLGADGFWMGCWSDEIGFLSHIVDRQLVGRIELDYKQYEVFAHGDYLYVTFADNDLLGKIDLRTGVVVGLVEVGDLPVDVLLINDSLWVTLAGRDEVAVLDPATLAVKARYPTGDEPWKLAYGLGSVWVTNRSMDTATKGSGTVSRLNPTTGERQQDDIAVGNVPDEIVVIDQAVYVGNVGDKNIGVVRAT